ncbi:MAG: hypothetical protein HY376_00440 [Candidatus Blackburnbacteria bacterium]|nr:hypothetical protein [Candidatus Blackburnbacteria bacterium]
MLTALLRLFFPHPRNKHRAHILHPLSFVFLIGAFIGLESLIFTHPDITSKILGASVNITPASIIELTNQKRAKEGLSTLKEDPVLDKAAQQKGADMMAKNYWAHNAPDGTTPWHFFNEAGYSYRYAGENLARDFIQPEGVVDAWIASPSHRENLFSQRYEDIGVAVVEGDLKGSNTILVVQMLGTKLNSALPMIGKATAPQVEPVNSLVQGEKVQLVSQVGGMFTATKTLGIGLLGFVIFILIADIFIVQIKRIDRHASRSSAHVMFLVAILFIVLIFEGGKIF